MGADISEARRRALERSWRLAWFSALPCLLVGAYFGLAALYALVHHDAYASTTPHALRYVIGPAFVSILFVGCALLLKRDSAILVGLIGLAALLAFFSMELIANVRSIPVILGNIGYMDPQEVKKRGGAVDAVRVIPPKGVNRVLKIQFLADAHLSPSTPNAKTLLCIRDGEPVYYTADKFGFNNPNEAYSAPMDVLVLGDSVMEGLCLEPGRDVLSRLRQSFPHSVGLAARSNGPLMELATLGRYGPVLRPQHVVVTFFAGNDWRNMQAELQLPWLRQALLPNADFGAVADQHSLLNQADQFLRHKREVGVWRLLLDKRITRNFLALQNTSRILGLYYPAVPMQIPEFAVVLKRMKEITEQWGGKVHLLFIPRMDRYVGLLPNQFAFDTLLFEVAAAARDAGVPVINMTPLFGKYPDAEIRFYSLGHLSETGAELVSQTISSRIAASDASYLNNAGPELSQD